MSFLKKSFWLIQFRMLFIHLSINSLKRTKFILKTCPIAYLIRTLLFALVTQFCICGAIKQILRRRS